MSDPAAKRTVALAADHAGFELKARLRAWLEEHGWTVIDHGTDSPESVDYPDYARRVATTLLAGDAARGVLVCGTGVGMAISANRIAGIRAVNCIDTFSARMARAHNDANVLALGARVLGEGLALELLRVFLEEPFEGGRHARRVARIEP